MKTYMLTEKLQQIYKTWFLHATIEQLQQKMDEGEITAKDLVFLYLHRIATYDQAGPKLNTILELNPDALFIAEALDDERQRNGKRSLMHGIPIVLKDSIDTGDKMHTSAGSYLLKDSYAKEDAFLVSQLRKAGAIILGKANMSEWSYFMSKYGMPSGYSSRGGQVLNPYNPGTVDVGGSSSGSAASVAAHFAAAAVGTETSGSILNPASQNSVIGIKPTVGLISRRGLIPISHTQDTAGPIARTVKDAVILLVSMIGRDDDDPATHRNLLSKEKLLEAADKTSLEGIRLGVVREGYINIVPQEKQHIINKAVQKIKANGAHIIEDVCIPSAKEKWSIDVLLYEFKANINAYLKNLNPPLTLNDIIQQNEADAGRMLRYGQSLLIEAEKTSGTLTEPAYLAALQFDHYHATKNGIDAALEKDRLDALIFVNNVGAPIAAKARYPSITVPAGYTEKNEPVGITFTGTKFSEETLIQIAAAFERMTNVRKNPTF